MCFRKNVSIRINCLLTFMSSNVSPIFGILDDTLKIEEHQPILRYLGVPFSLQLTSKLKFILHLNPFLQFPNIGVKIMLHTKNWPRKCPIAITIGQAFLIYIWDKIYITLPIYIIWMTVCPFNTHLYILLNLIPKQFK